MEENDLVSIIIPVYNVEKYLEKCIISCLNQTYNNIEVIAIDDGSTDNSKNILDNLAQKYSNLVVIHKENSGVSATRNIGIKKSNGKYIVFVDADDYLANTAISYMMEVVSKTSSEFAILKNCFTSTDQLQLKNTISKISNEDATALLISLTMEIGCWNKIYKKSMLINNNIWFNEKLFYGEGLEFILKVAQLANGIGLGTKRVYYYRKNNLYSATSSFNYQKFINGEQALLKIKDEFIINSQKVNELWEFHYAMFAENVIHAFLNNRNKIPNYKKIVKEWEEKFNKHSKKLIFSRYITTREKLKIIIIRISPKLFSHIRNKRIKKVVERSV